MPMKEGPPKHPTEFASQPLDRGRRSASKPVKAPVPSVYLADEDKVFRDNVAHVLRQGGADVVEFSSGSELSAQAVRGKPDLILLTSNRDDLDGCQVFARLKSQRTGKRYPLVLMTDKNRPLEQIARSVQSFLTDWNRLCIRNLAGVLAFLQTRRASGRFEVTAFGERGTVLLHHGEVVEAHWKELRGREVLRFFGEELPDAGFRFAERVDEEAEEPGMRRQGVLPAPKRYLAPAAEVGEAAAEAGGAASEAGGAVAIPSAAESPLPTVEVEGYHPAQVRHDTEEILGFDAPPSDDPSRVEAHIKLARALLGGRRLGQAFLHLRMAESLADRPGEVQYLMGVAHLKSGDLAVAVKELQAARGALPGDMRVIAALAEVQRRLDRQGRARSLPEVDARTAEPSGPAGSGADPTGEPKEVGPEPAQAVAAPPQPLVQPPVEPRPEDTTATALELQEAERRKLAKRLLRSGRPPPIPTLDVHADSTMATSRPAVGGADPTGSAPVEPRLVSATASGPGLRQDDLRSLEREPHGGRSRRRDLIGLAVALAILLGLSTALVLLAQGYLPVAVATLLTDRGSARSERQVRESIPRLAQRLERESSSSEERSGAGETGRGEIGREEIARPETALTGPQTLDALRGRPRIVDLDSRPVPSRLLDSRSTRALIGAGSGRLQIIPAWSDSIATEHKAAMWVLVDASGRVQDVRVLTSSGASELDEMAIDAIRNLRFIPARRGGAPVPAWIQQRVVFNPD
jgi:TonB family protein